MLLGLQHSINWHLINFSFWGTHQMPCTFRMHICPMQKEGNFSWRLTTHFSDSFQEAYKSIWTRCSKATCCIQGARKSLWKEQTYKPCNLSILSEFWARKKNTDLYTCFKHLPKCKAEVNQVTAICMLISILSRYRGVQEESWKAFNVLFSIPSQHVIIAKPSLPFFFFNRLRRMQIFF